MVATKISAHYQHCGKGSFLQKILHENYDKFLYTKISRYTVYGIYSQ